MCWLLKHNAIIPVMVRKQEDLVDVFLILHSGPDSLVLVFPLYVIEPLIPSQ